LDLLYVSLLDELTAGLGPSLGGLLASGVYMLLKFLRYEEVNGTADRDETSHGRGLSKSDLHSFFSETLTPMTTPGQRTSYFEGDDVPVFKGNKSPSTSRRGENAV